MEALTKPRVHESAMSPAQVPLCVDGDGTLIRSDVLVESAIELLKRNPLYLFAFPVWLARGRAHLKRQIARRVAIDSALLPYNEQLLELLSTEKKRGRRLVLATAADELIARAIATHIGLFEEVIASDGDTNLSGHKKRDALVTRFGSGGFDYAGNSYADVEIWRAARRAIVVNPEPGLTRTLGKAANVELVLNDAGGWREYLRAMRPHQWLKNLLVFLPLATAHELDSIPHLLSAALAFVAFGLCASSVYLLNDLVDLPSDRQHPRKRQRPFAAGTASVKAGVALAPALLVGGIGVSLLLPWQFVAVLAAYYASTLAYSFWLKQKVLVDVFLLAGLYTLRVIAGGAAVAITPSFWLLAFSMFLFLSLAMLKRYTELRSLQERNETRVGGRGYEQVDLATIAGLGHTSGYMSVLVLALYINSDAVLLLYRVPEIIWLLCPLVLYWVSRMWQRAGRGEMHDDPIVFAIKDHISRYVVGAGAVILLSAAWI